MLESIGLGASACAYPDTDCSQSFEVIDVLGVFKYLASITQGDPDCIDVGQPLPSPTPAP
jgi:hypothetical protein